MLDLRRLRLLSELARRGTIAEVARGVGYTASAVSQSLSQLEREVGLALLERDGRRVRLTPAAHALVARTDRVLAELDAAEAELAAEQQTVRGEVVIGSFPSAATGLVVPAAGELARRHPDLSCSVREHEPEDGIALLRSGELTHLLVSESYGDVESAPQQVSRRIFCCSTNCCAVVPAGRRPVRPGAARRARAGRPGSSDTREPSSPARGGGWPVDPPAFRGATRGAPSRRCPLHRRSRGLLGAGVALLPVLACCGAGWARGLRRGPYRSRPAGGTAGARAPGRRAAVGERGGPLSRRCHVTS